MDLNKLLWASLTGALGIIILMAASWAAEVKTTSAGIDHRVGVTEQHYAAIQADLQDLREHIKEIKEMMKEQASRKP